MYNKNTRHVIKHHKKGWANRKGDAVRAASIHECKDDAILKAREMAIANKEKLYVHDIRFGYILFTEDYREF